MTPELDAVLSRSNVWRRLYETDARYRTMWDAGTGPGQRHDRELIHTARYNHWAPLHKYAVEHADKWDETAARAFYKQWKKSIPNTGGCSCQAKWKKLGMVPDYWSPQAFFEWAWLAHDTVTQRLITEGKPLTRLTLVEAYSTWGFSVADPVHQTA